MKTSIVVISLLTFVSFCYGDESTTTAEGLTLTEILSQAGIAEPNEIISASDETTMNAAVTMLMGMLASALEQNADGLYDQTDETVNAILNMLKMVLSMDEDMDAAGEASEATAAGAVESSSEISERGPFEIAQTGNFGLSYSGFGTEQLTEGGSTKSMGEPLRIPADTVLTGDVVWEGEVILEGWVFLPDVYDPNDLIISDPNDQLVYDPNEELVCFTIKPGTYIHGDPCVYDIGIWLSPGHNIKWNGLPDNRITFAFVPEVMDWDNWHGIVIEGEPASFEMNYCDVLFASCGIYQFGTGDLKIQNNRFFACNTGVVKNGPGKIEIANNAFQETWHGGIEVFMERALEPNYLSEASSDTEVIITNNTIVGSYADGRGQKFGIIVHGVSELEDAGIVEIANNLLVASRTCAIVQEGGYMLCQSRKNNAYAGNILNVNEGNPIPDVNSIELLYDPFEYYYDSGTTFLWQESEAVDGGLFEVDETPLVYMSTSVDGTTDTGMLDIGYHWTAWDWSNDGLILDTDVNEDYVVDCNDLYYLSLSWLEDPNVPPDPNDYPGGVLPTDPNLFYLFPNKRADINEDMIVDYVDFALFSKQWLWEGMPGIGKIEPEFDQDPCNLSNIVTVTFNTYGADPPVIDIITLMDGLPVEDGECSTEFLPYEAYSPTIDFDTREYENGRRELKFIGLRYDAPALCSSVIPVTFNNQHTNVKISRDDNYTYIFASADANSIATVKIIDPRYESGTEEVVFDKVFNGRVAARIPDSYIQRPDLPYNVTIDRDEGGEKSGDPPSYEVVISREFRKKDFPQDIDIRMVISVDSDDLWRAKRTLVTKVIREALADYIYVVFLGPGTCNWDNLSHCLNIDRVKMWYHLSHGAADLWFNPPRECIMVGGDRVFSFLRKDFETVPSDYENMRWYYENNHSIAELGFWDNPKFIWVQFNCCESAATTEFPTHLGMTGPGQPQGGSIFIGWKEKVPAYDIIGPEYNKWEWNLWDWLGRGFNLQHAYDEADTGVRDSDKIEMNFTPMPNGPLSLQHVWFNYPRIDTDQ